MVNNEGNKPYKQTQYTRPQNLRGYCHTQTFHPGLGHNSQSCQRKRDGHECEATWSNRMEGNTYWLEPLNVALDQHEHVTWKGKSAPTS